MSTPSALSATAGKGRKPNGSPVPETRPVAAPAPPAEVARVLQPAADPGQKVSRAARKAARAGIATVIAAGASHPADPGHQVSRAAPSPRAGIATDTATVVSSCTTSGGGTAEAVSTGGAPPKPASAGPAPKAEAGRKPWVRQVPGAQTPKPEVASRDTPPPAASPVADDGTHPVAASGRSKAVEFVYSMVAKLHAGRESIGPQSLVDVGAGSNGLSWALIEARKRAATHFPVHVSSPIAQADDLLRVPTIVRTRGPGLTWTTAVPGVTGCHHMAADCDCGAPRARVGDDLTPTGRHYMYCHSFYYLDLARDFRHVRVGDTLWVVTHVFRGDSGSIAGEFDWYARGATPVATRVTDAAGTRRIFMQPRGAVAKPYLHPDVTPRLDGFSFRTSDGQILWAYGECVRHFAREDTYVYKYYVSATDFLPMPTLAEFLASDPPAPAPAVPLAAPVPVAEPQGEVGPEDTTTRRMLHNLLSTVPIVPGTESVAKVAAVVAAKVTAVSRSTESDRTKLVEEAGVVLREMARDHASVMRATQRLDRAQRFEYGMYDRPIDDWIKVGIAVLWWLVWVIVCTSTYIVPFPTIVAYCAYRRYVLGHEDSVVFDFDNPEIAWAAVALVFVSGWLSFWWIFDAGVIGVAWFLYLTHRRSRLGRSSF